VEAERADLLATGVLGVLARELPAALVDRGVEEDARDEKDCRDQRGDNECDSAERESGQ
jgi:hypothetical protein